MIMKHSNLVYSIIILSLLISNIGFANSPKDNVLKVNNLELGYPCPAIPFYHFIAELELPQPSIIEV